MLRINNIKLPLTSTLSDLETIALKKLKVKKINKLEISKKSIDARKKTDIFYIYNIDVDIDDEYNVLKKINDKNISVVSNKIYAFPTKSTEFERPVIIGTGPAGLFAGLVLAQGGYNPILLERGACVEERTKIVNKFWTTSTLDTETNVQFGEGGAGTFSDGKLTTGIKDFRISKVIDEFVNFGAPVEIKYLSKPHIGTDILKNVVRGIREEIIRLGGEVRFNSKADKIIVKNNKVKSVVVVQYTKQYEIPTKNIILATGHSARDTFYMLDSIGVKMEQKPFSMGMRIEHTQDFINEAQYGEFKKHLGAADYKLSVHLKNGRGVYTFCMCPGGFVVNASSEKGRIVTNGMSNFLRNEKNANSAILVSVTSNDFSSINPLEGINFQREIEEKAYKTAGANYYMPVQTVGGFLKNMTDKKIGNITPTVLPGYTLCNMHDIFPEFITNSILEALPLFNKKISGFLSNDAIFTGPETRSSSPVKILRDRFHMTNIWGLYAAGEGGGHAGGIISSAVDGIKTAEMIIREGN